MNPPPTPRLDHLCATIPSVSHARSFAIEAHESVGQVRQGSKTPYWFHVVEVAELVATHNGETNLVIAALLHDVLEDVSPFRDQYGTAAILDEFGKKILMLVLELTNIHNKTREPDLNRAVRKAREHARLSAVSAGAKTVKLADVLANNSSAIAGNIPFTKVFVKESSDLIPRLLVTDFPGNAVLHRLALEANALLAAAVSGGN